MKPCQRNFLLTVIASAVLGAVGSSTAYAQAQAAPGSDLSRQIDEAYRQQLAQPGNADAVRNYVNLMISAGNYEGGIAALERLAQEPGAPASILYDLGTLYYRLESYAEALRYLQAALAASSLPANLRGPAQALANECINRLAPSRWSGVALASLRHQSNAAYRSGDSQIFSAGALVPTPANARPRSNTDLTVGVRAQHNYDLGAQNLATIASQFGAFYVGYASSSGSTITATPSRPHNLIVLDASTGVRFKPLPADVTGLSIRPHILLTTLLAQEKRYLSTAGLGLDVVQRFSEWTVLEVTADSRRRRFASRADLTNADLVSGRLSTLRGTLRHELAPGHVLALELGGSRNRTQRAFYDYRATDVKGSYTLSFASPLQQANPWSATFSLGSTTRRYGAPDPAVTAATTRNDREWTGGVSLLVPFSSPWALGMAVEHARARSNLTNFNYRNSSVSGSVYYRF